MASQSDSSDSDEERLPQKRIIGKSFSIESLLRPEPQILPWDRLIHPSLLGSALVQRQVCPLPPNILVPPNLFKKFPRSLEQKDGESSKVEVGEDHPNISEEDAKSPTGDSEGEGGEEYVATEGSTKKDGSEDDERRFKKKRPRTAFSVPQIRALEAEFERNRYLTGGKRKELSRQLKLSETQIKIWFQNRRTKLKRKNVSEMETWVQQLYSPMGPRAPRPLVIGDQLYLFHNPESNPGLMYGQHCDTWRHSWS